MQTRGAISFNDENLGKKQTGAVKDLITNVLQNPKDSIPKQPTSNTSAPDQISKNDQIKISVEDQTPEEKGVDQSKAEIVQKEETSKKRLDELLNKSVHELLHIKTAIPLDPFPNEIIIDRSGVSIINREFFGSEIVHKIAITDLVDVLVETTPFFATLKIIDKGYTENEIPITGLKTSDAQKARRIIEGLRICLSNQIDLAVINDDELVDKLEELGRSRRDSRK